MIDGATKSAYAKNFIFLILVYINAAKNAPIRPPWIARPPCLILNILNIKGD